VKDATFTAYWRPNCPVKVMTPEEARASVYTWGDAALKAVKSRVPFRAAIPVANRLPEDAEVTIQVDLRALGLSTSVAAVDERTGKRLAIKNGQFTVRVKGRNYTYVSLR
jgi:hypothetical protein